MIFLFEVVRVEAGVGVVYWYFVAGFVVHICAGWGTRAGWGTLFHIGHTFAGITVPWFLGCGITQDVLPVMRGYVFGFDHF